MTRMLRTPLLLAASLVLAPGGALAHGLMTDPPSRNARCGMTIKPDQAAGTICNEAFRAPGVDPNTGYNFMSVLTHTTGYAGVGARTNVCSFNAEPWSGAATPWDQPINWPTASISSGPLNITWNISWGPHFDDTQEFRYWITKPDFVYTVGRPLSFSDFESQPFCYLTYSDANPSGNPNVVPNKGAATFLTKCNVPARSGRHVIYGEWGRNYFTYERFHGCIDVSFGGGQTPTSYTLGVTKSGTGSGTVTSSPAGVNCGATCSASFTSGTSVVLSAAAAAGSTFAGWSGACTGTAATCTVSMTQARTVTATFNSTSTTSYTLSVTKAGTGAGTVYSTPAGITCGATCSASFPSGTVVTLVGDVAAGSSFAGWSGACTGTGPCTVTMSQARSVSATFNTTSGTTYALTVTKSGTGSGTVTSNPVGISCGSTCSATFNSGVSVTLTATAASGSTFSGWSGACTGTSATCVTTMTAARSVGAAFGGGSTGGTTPCSNPITFTSQSGNFNTTGAVCLRTSMTVRGWGCSNFAGRTVSVNGGTATATCGAGPFPLPKHTDGYTYFSVTAGQYPWASLYAWQ
ncbi:MAG TPA: lytic polysaccharide monooxygenase [Anaeromyxobacter sp.]|nr:lytic polysaccharide monooxygenase [Anaeromyxobacter sp.]